MKELIEKREAFLQDYKLQEYKDFVNLEGSFGGDQKWLKETMSDFIVKRSCSLAAAANILSYQVYNDKSKQSKEHYTLLMSKLHNFIKPRIWGVPFINYFYEGLKDFAQTENLYVSMEKYSGDFSLNSVKEFISQGLERDCPVILLTWNHKDKLFHNHWVTITRLYVLNGKVYINVSSWGKKYTRDLGEYLNAWSLKRELAYFKF